MTCSGCGQVDTAAIAEDWWRRHTDDAAAAERLAEGVWQFWTGSHAATVRWLQALGCTLIGTETTGPSAYYTLDGLTGIRVALGYPAGDPLNLAACFGFLVAGTEWPTVFPTVSQLVKAKWTAERKTREKAAAS